jgi:hypothetical protein
MDYEATRRLLAALERHQVAYAIFGAVALGVHGLTRFTEDLDLFVSPEASNIDRLKQALRDVFDDPSIDEISPVEMAGPYPAIRYVPPTGSFYLDIVTRLGEAFAFADLETERVPFDGLTVTVVSAKTLYRMKRDTVRLKDRADAEALKRHFRWESD